MSGNGTSERGGDPTGYPLPTHACSLAPHVVYGLTTGAARRAVLGVL